MGLFACVFMVGMFFLKNYPNFRIVLAIAMLVGIPTALMVLPGLAGIGFSIVFIGTFGKFFFDVAVDGAKQTEQLETKRRRTEQLKLKLRAFHLRQKK